MKVKVGQWCRNSTHIFKLEKINKVDFGGGDLEIHYEYHILNDSMNYYCCEDDIIKVADTPQELIQVGDLVEHQAGSNTFIDEVKMLLYRFIYIKSGYSEHKDVTKILTPNSNGGYDKQWEAK